MGAPAWDLKKYFTRLTVFTVVSQVPITFFMNTGSLPSNVPDYFSYLNVIFVITLGVLAVHIRRRIRNPVLKYLLILCLALASVSADWGIFGVIFIVVFDIFYGCFKKQAVAYGIFAFFYCGMTFDLNTLGLFIPIVLLALYRGRRGRGGKAFKWLFYIFYPLHFIVIGVLYAILG